MMDSPPRGYGKVKAGLVVGRGNQDLDRVLLPDCGR